MDETGRIVVADTDNHIIRVVSWGGDVETVAGNPEVEGYMDVQGEDAVFNEPRSVVMVPNGEFLVADTGNDTIRAVTGEGTVRTWAGNGKAGFAAGQGSSAHFNSPRGMAIDLDGSLLVAIWRVTTPTMEGVVGTFVGNGEAHTSRLALIAQRTWW